MALIPWCDASFQSSIRKNQRRVHHEPGAPDPPPPWAWPAGNGTPLPRSEADLTVVVVLAGLGRLRVSSCHQNLVVVAAQIACMASHGNHSPLPYRYRIAMRCREPALLVASAATPVYRACGLLLCVLPLLRVARSLWTLSSCHKPVFSDETHPARLSYASRGSRAGPDRLGLA